MIVSPSASVAIPGSYATGDDGFAILVAKDANGNTGLGVSLTTTSTFTVAVLTGGIPTTYSSGGTNYLFGVLNIGVDIKGKMSLD
jgi:hypothetical protein